MSAHAFLDINGSMVSPQIEGIISLLSDDERPTFVLEVSKSRRIAYRNPSLTSLVANSHLESWISTLSDDILRPADWSSVRYAGQFQQRAWFSKSIGDLSWTVIYCSREDGKSWKPEADVQPNTSSNVSITDDPLPLKHVTDLSSDKISNWFCDWIHNPDIISNKWCRFLVEYDWEQTELGPIQNWPLGLCRLAIYALSAPDPRLILWGDNLLGLFNEAAKPILGEKYLACLGHPLAEGLGPSAAEQDLDILRRSVKSGTSTKEINMEYLLTRSGFAEECYFDLHISPVPNDDGYLSAAVIEFRETTTAVINERKQHVASALFDHIVDTKDRSTLWSRLVEGLVREPKYISYALVYTRDEDSYLLRASTGVDTSALGHITVCNDEGNSNTLASALHDAGGSPEVSVLRQTEGALPPELAIDVAQRGVIETAVILPIEGGAATSQPTAFVVIGMNPKLIYTDDDRHLAGHLRDVISQSFAVIAHPESHSRATELEALNLELARKLKISTKEVKKSEQDFARMASNAPFGMYSFGSDGTPIFVNESWLRMTGFKSLDDFKERSSQSQQYWVDMVPPEDVEDMAANYLSIMTSTNPTKYEYRVLVPQQEREHFGQDYRWVEAISFPELDEENKIVGMKGWLVDISDRKKAENLMAKNLHDALETKWASERFIDSVSNEIRNPLSAILQLADSILTSAETSSGAANESIIDAARTIILCTNHMRKIVTDVLVMSKLDSNLLVLSPDTCQPPALINKALKIHEAELARAGIEASLQIEHSYKDLAIDSVLMDEGRVLQVLLNLLGNAIKFTQGPGTRKVSIHLTAHRDIPTGEEYNLKFAAPRQKRSTDQRSNSVSLKDESSKEVVYLQVAILDTGRGLTQEEIERIFHRFSQASPKTYKKYGGTGLGLYISKELTELQGGRIGVKSEGHGKGACFAFYVKCWRTDPPAMTPVSEASVAVKEVASMNKPGQNDNVLVRTQKVTVTDTSARDMHVLGMSCS